MIIPREVYILNNLKSDYIEQAILVLKHEKDLELNKSEILKEAEKIVVDYDKRNYSIQTFSKRQSRILCKPPKWCII